MRLPLKNIQRHISPLLLHRIVRLFRIKDRHIFILITMTKNNLTRQLPVPEIIIKDSVFQGRIPAGVLIIKECFSK